LKPEDTTFYNTRISTVKKSLEPAQSLKPPPGLGSEVLVSGGEDVDATDAIEVVDFYQ